MNKIVSYKATSIESFKTGINNLEYIIDFSGPDAQKAIKKLDKNKKLNLGSKLITAAITIALIAGSGGTLAFIGAGAGVVTATLTKNMKKYDAEIISEDHVIFTLKEKYRNKKLAKDFK